MTRLRWLAGNASTYMENAESLPEFFHHCFAVKVRAFLLAARDLLDWRNIAVDRTAMALLLVYLHGKHGSALSNQMRQTKSMAPDYAVKWWKERRLAPPDMDPVDFMVKRLAWRYAKGVPVTAKSEMHLGDAGEALVAISRRLRQQRRRVGLIFTSPPYFGLTNYHYDQWLRLWLLGGAPNAYRVPGTSEMRGKFENGARYIGLLESVFSKAAPTLASDGTVYVRTGAGELTLSATRAALLAAFPEHRLEEVARPYTKPTQTSLFGDSTPKAGEVDLIMRRCPSGPTI
ncbi:hypothetical protein V6V47_08930 [Micromonospora sp. CPCC 205539]|uniref:hypothetical protein n=1 Tax=Micromonospora sp. CPCC 205539 TaxID=3122408 RepID=UPI002FF39A11